MGNHSEVIQVEYDPQQITYERLLAVFWESHLPTYEVGSRQYRNAVFTLTDEQRKKAEASRIAQAKALRAEIFTAIEPAGTFTPAEGYHQKYLLRKATSVFNAIERIYPEVKDLVASTAAARLNGYLGCNGDPEALAKEIHALGLSPEQQARLIEYVTTSCDRFAGLTCPAPQ